MDLRPLNPYYRQPAQAVAGGAGVSGRRKAGKGYRYPYTWQAPVTDRTREDVEHARQILSLDWKDMDDGDRKSVV